MGLPELATPAYGYANGVSIHAMLRVNEMPVPDYPFAVSFTEPSVIASMANAGGQSAASTTVPATVTDTVSIRVAPDGDGRAVTFAPATAPVPSGTEGAAFGTNAREAGNEAVVIDGRLGTDKGEAASDQPVAIGITG